MMFPMVVPRAPVTVTETDVRPARRRDPLMIPVCESSVSPAGKLVAANVSGPAPDAGMRNRNGLPGVAPVMRGLLIRGSASRFDAIMGAGSAGGATADGRVAASAITIAAPPQSAMSSVPPSPPSPTYNVICFAPVRSTEIGFGGSPARMIPESYRLAPSVHTSKVTEPRPVFRASSIPTIDTNRVALPSSAIHSSPSAATPSPCE